MTSATHTRSSAAAQAVSAVRFLVGVDGGGTGTRLRLTGIDGRLLGQGDSGPSALGQGVEQAWAHIQLALQQACQQAGIASLDLSECAIGLGLSGAGLAVAVAEFIATQPGYAHVELDNDGYTTVLGAHAGQPGAVIASGTGSVGEAVRRDGSRVCIGGWGWVIGDEGSGAWLGQKAMRHAHQALDGRAESGPLARAIWAKCGRDRETLLAWCASAGQHGYASLAPLVFEHADTDPAAQTFVNEAVAELEKLAAALDPSGDLPMALCGSIALRLGPLFSPALRQRCVPPQGDSAAGALLMIRRAISEMGRP